MRTYKDASDVKICCYAISAGEPTQFIDEWLASMNGADYICVLVTKEGDPNWYYFNEKRKEYGDKLIVKQKTIKPWRFDVARNESMKLIPDDADVLICTDIDERLDSDFWNDLRKIVYEHPNFRRIYYRYAWSHDDNGNPKWVFWYDKITQAKGWKWDYPVHEALICSNNDYSGEYYMPSEKIYLHHYPDKTKSRSSYLGLLKQRAEEYPDDLYGLYYLAREYSFISDYKNALKTAYDLYLRISEVPVRDDMRMLPSVLCMLGDFSLKLNISNTKEDAEFFYRKSIKAEPTFRDGYMKLAQLLAYQPRPDEALEVVSDMCKYSRYQEDWRLTTYYWRTWKLNQILADIHCWKEDYQSAYELMQVALEDIRTEDDRNDAIREGFYNDLDFIKDKLELK